MSERLGGQKLNLQSRKLHRYYNNGTIIIIIIIIVLNIVFYLSQTSTSLTRYICCKILNSCLLNNAQIVYNIVLWNVLFYTRVMLAQISCQCVWTAHCNASLNRKIKIISTKYNSNSRGACYTCVYRILYITTNVYFETETLLIAPVRQYRYALLLINNKRTV